MVGLGRRSVAGQRRPIHREVNDKIADLLEVGAHDTPLSRKERGVFVGPTLSRVSPADTVVAQGNPRAFHLADRVDVTLLRAPDRFRCGKVREAF